MQGLNGILIMVTYSKKLSVFLIASLLGIFSRGVVFAKDNGNAVKLQEIDTHIENREYNEALKILSEFIRDNPSQFDEAQKRVQIIMHSRELLTQLADELIYVIENDPENDERKLELIKQIESIEVNPSSRMKSFLESTRRAAEFAVNHIKFQNIIAEGSRLTHEGQYSEAVLNQVHGFSVYYDSFVRENDDETVAAVNRLLDTVKSAVGRFPEISLEAENAFESLRKALQSDDTAATQSAVRRVQTAMAEYASVRNTIVSVGYTFQDMFTVLAAQQGLETEASYLPFAWRFILGSSSEQDSGMAGAMDMLWNLLVEQTKPDTLTAALIHLDACISLNGSGSTESVSAMAAESEKQLAAAQTFLSVGDQLEKLAGLLEHGTPSPLRDENFSLLISDMRNTCTWMQGIILNDQSYRTVLSQIPAKIYEEALAAAEDAVRTGNFSWITSAVETYHRIESLNQAATEYCAGISEIAGRVQNLNGAVSSQDFMESIRGLGVALRTESDSSLKQLENRFSTYIQRASELITEHTVLSYEEALTLLNESLDPTLSSYPQKVVPLTETLLPQCASLQNQLTVLQQIVSPVVSSDPVEKAVAQIIRIAESTRALQAAAEDRIRQATRIFAEGELRYTEARTAITRDDYTSARSSIQKAGSKYAESFLYREDSTLRAQCDAKLMALGEEINRLENERIVLEVRRLKKQAKNEYYAGNFESADSLLQQAKARWLITNVEDDPEIVQLLALVGTALSMKTGRTISPSAPLYPEMSQTLNIAHSYFAQGESLLKNGNRAEGVTALQNALQKIRELQLVYPLNQEASLMSLQISKLIDPAAFETYFAQKVRTAKEEYKDKEKQRQVYADLLDLYEINPSYPGLKDFIYTVEIELGVRQKPIDRSTQIKSDSLYKEALTLYNKNNRDEINLRSALAKVDDALAQNPDNEDAQTLKDRINIALGGSGSVVLPSEAESMYQKAVQELQKGNTIQAAAIVMQLMQNPEYAKSAKILDLKKKVDSLL